MPEPSVYSNSSEEEQGVGIFDNDLSVDFSWIQNLTLQDQGSDNIPNGAGGAMPGRTLALQREKISNFRVSLLGTPPISPIPHSSHEVTFIQSCSTSAESLSLERERFSSPSHTSTSTRTRHSNGNQRWSTAATRENPSQLPMNFQGAEYYENPFALQLVEKSPSSSGPSTGSSNIFSEGDVICTENFGGHSFDPFDIRQRQREQQRRTASNYCTVLPFEYHRRVTVSMPTAQTQFVPARVPNYYYHGDVPVSRLQSILVGHNGFKYWGLTADSYSDKIYFSDRSTGEVTMVDANTRQLLARFGQHCYPGTKNLFRPTGLAYDKFNRRLIVCDKDNHRICFFTLDGRFISEFGRKGHFDGQFNYPWDAAISPFGDQIAVADFRNHRIQIFDRFGNFINKFSVFESDPFEFRRYFDYPRGITFDNQGANLYVTDFNTHNVLGLNLTNWQSRLLVPFGKMCRPQGITVDEVGNLLVSDSKRRCIRVMTPDGRLLQSIQSVGPQSFHLPGDLEIMRGGRVALVDLAGLIHIF